MRTIGVSVRYEQRIYSPQPVLGEPLDRCCLERLSSIDDDRAGWGSQSQRQVCSKWAYRGSLPGFLTLSRPLVLRLRLCFPSGVRLDKQARQGT